MFDDFLDLIGFNGDDVGEDAFGDSWMDMDGDGMNESIMGDFDGDGIIDHVANSEDVNGDLEFDAVTEMDDYNANGAWDHTESVAFEPAGAEAYDEYDHFDLAESDDDHSDYYSHIEEADTSGYEVMDYVANSEDVNGDLEFDAVTEMDDYNANGAWDYMESIAFEPAGAEAYDEYDYFDPAESDGNDIAGDPGAALDSWHTQTGNTCAVVSQEGILESIFGQEFDEDELRELAEDNGWYNNGTSAEDVGQLLEYYGVHTEQSSGNSIDDLRDSLENGNQIIVMVDADELWSGENEEMFGPGMDMDHAVRVIGIDESDPENPRVIINDSGVANGRGVMIPLNDFMDSWEDSGCRMVEAFPGGSI